MSDVKGEEKKELGVGTRDGKGKLLRYRVKGQRRQLRRKGRPGQRCAQQDQPREAAPTPGPPRRPLTWSPHAGVNRAARPAGLGEQLCHLPALSGGQALSAGSHPERKPQVRPLRKGKYPGWKAHPSRQRPQIVRVGEVGVVRQSASRLEELTPTEAPPGAARNSCPSPLLPPGQIWNRTCGPGEKVGP